jgi:outer membrane protein assembly factor BamB
MLRRALFAASSLAVLAATSVFASAASSLASDWTNLGGNAARNGMSAETGPTSATVLWNNTTYPSIIAWQPVTLGNRVFTVRESGFPSGSNANDQLIAYDINTGAKLWNIVVPFNGTATDWIAWIAGAKNGKVYASRASNGKPGRIYEFDAATGAPGWTSVATTQAFAYDGVVFAPDGDLLVGDLSTVVRIDSATGNTVWTFNRTRAVSGNCGVCCTANAVFLDNGFFASSQWVTKIDLATGTFLYESPHIPGGSEQNQPFLSPDGLTVYLSRTQNNPATAFRYAFSDTGCALSLKWQAPVRWTTSHEFGVANDGSIYTFLQDDEFVRLSALNGQVMNTAGVLSPLGNPNLSPKTAVDANGIVYVSNGWAGTPSTNGRVWAFSYDLQQNYFTLNLSNPNQGGPALGNDGTLVVCDLNGVQAYRSSFASIYCTAKTNSQGCKPETSFAGIPSASDPYFTIYATNELNNKNGLFFYGTNGAQALSFQGGTLCVKSPIKRTSVQSSGGNPPPNDCSGAYAIDFNAVIQSGVDPALVAGALVDGQWWARDPVDPFTTSLSNAVEFTIQP